MYVQYEGVPTTGFTDPFPQHPAAWGQTLTPHQQFDTYNTAPVGAKSDGYGAHDGGMYGVGQAGEGTNSHTQ
jgi:hypothetical protein